MDFGVLFHRENLGAMKGGLKESRWVWAVPTAASLHGQQKDHADLFSPEE